MAPEKDNGKGPETPDGVQEGIPASADQRRRLLRCIRGYAAAEGLVGPISFDGLMRHVDRILKPAGFDAKFKNYATVLLHNEAWREALAAVPFGRRLLLLPLCLRNADRCQGEMDEYGLVCRQCSACAINELTAEAKRLGYVALVCEGTAVVMSLIESGKIEAVVGVGCLSSLQRVYPLMEASGIPGIAIPLLRDGCEDTAVDLDWVREAMSLCGPERAAGPGMDTLRRRVNRWFAPEALDEVLGGARTNTEQIAREWLMRSGKRWRPFLAACAFEALREGSDGDPPADLRRIGVAVECFHKASLVHDDIEDADPLRYGRKTLHEEHGLPVALNVGDFLLGEGYRLLGECDAPAAVRAALLGAAAAGHRDLCLGQGQELYWQRNRRPLSVEEVVEIFRHKTAPAFEVALRFGAILAGADEELAPILRRVSRHLGIAYQIRDDLEDFHGDDGDDCGALRPSILMALAHAAATGADREFMDAAWRGSEKFTASELARRVEALGAPAAAEEKLAAHRARAEESLDPLDSADLKRLLRQVLGKIFRGDRKGPTGESQGRDASGGGRGAGSAA